MTLGSGVCFFLGGGVWLDYEDYEDPLLCAIEPKNIYSPDVWFKELIYLLQAGTTKHQSYCVSGHKAKCSFWHSETSYAKANVVSW